MSTTDGYVTDAVTHIVNVQWGGDVYVVFSLGFPETSFGADLTLTLTNEKAVHVDDYEFTLSYPNTVPALIKNHIFKMPHDIGQFIDGTLPNISDPNVLFPSADCYIFAVAAADSLNTVKDALHDFYDSRLNPDIPNIIYPSGLLWWVGVYNYPLGAKSSWKIRYGKHRSDAAVSPPNEMAQCYPLAVMPTSHVLFPGLPEQQDREWNGYQVFAYRLDSSGTGQVYGANRMAPEWSNDINPVTIFSHTSYRKGVLFGDPPPMITADQI